MIIAFDLIEPEDAQTSPLLREERLKAIHDLVETNDFKLVKYPGCDCRVTLSVDPHGLMFHFRSRDDEELQSLLISPRPYRKLVQDYFAMVESYEAIRAEGNLYKLEAVDMARRAVHNEAAELLMSRLADKIEMDFESARRLFTLICALHLGQEKHLKSS